MPIAAEELEPLLMRRLRVNRGGPDAAEGMLVGVMADYFALLLPSGDVVYIVNRHVKSVTDQSDRPGNRVRQAPAVAQVPFSRTCCVPWWDVRCRSTGADPRKSPA